MTNKEAIKILERIQDEGLTEDAWTACQIAIESLNQKVVEEKSNRIKELEEEIFRIKIDSDYLSRKDWERIDQCEAEIKELKNDK